MAAAGTAQRLNHNQDKAMPGCCCTPLIPAQRQESERSLRVQGQPDYTVRPCLKKTKTGRQTSSCFVKVFEWMWTAMEHTHRGLRGDRLRLRRANHTGRSSTAPVTASRSPDGPCPEASGERAALSSHLRCPAAGSRLHAKVIPSSKLNASVSAFHDVVDILTQTHRHP